MVSHTHGFIVEKPDHVDPDLWAIIENCLQQSADRRIDIEDLINKLQPFTIGRRAVYVNEYMHSQDNLNSQHHSTDLINYDNIVHDFPEDDSYSQEKLDFRFPSSPSDNQNRTSIPAISKKSEKSLDGMKNSDVVTTVHPENNLSDEYQVEYTDTEFDQEKNTERNIEKKYVKETFARRESLHEEKIYKNQEEQTYDDETQPLDNTDQITDADINVSLKRPLLGSHYKTKMCRTNLTQLIFHRKVSGKRRTEKNVLLSLDPLEADFSEEFSAPEFQYGDLHF